MRRNQRRVAKSGSANSVIHGGDERACQGEHKRGRKENRALGEGVAGEGRGQHRMTQANMSSRTASVDVYAARRSWHGDLCFLSSVLPRVHCVCVCG